MHDFKIGDSKKPKQKMYETIFGLGFLNTAFTNNYFTKTFVV